MNADRKDRVSTALDAIEIAVREAREAVQAWNAQLDETTTEPKHDE